MRHIASGKLFVGGNGSNFAYQLIAGVSYAFRYNMDIGIDYRYLDTGDTDAVSFYAPVQYRAGKAHTVMEGLRWYPFAEKAAPPPAPPPPPPPAPLSPPPAPPPPPPPPARTFIVFFDFDRSNLTDEAQATVREAVSAAKTQGPVRIKVTGHTDTVGSDRYNQALSLRRAQSVKDEMVHQGLIAGDIAIEGRGFQDPLVQTGPGVREPKNRRALIDLGN
jgi:outer membrane protein OmpA-like peptidoglycan-associated protein